MAIVFAITASAYEEDEHATLYFDLGLSNADILAFLVFAFYRTGYFIFSAHGYIYIFTSRPISNIIFT